MKDTTIECFECGGEGEYEGTYPECSKPASHCCGGCYKKYECETCQGTGELYPKDEDHHDYFLMVKAYESMLNGFKLTLKQLKEFQSTVCEDAFREMEFLLDHKYNDEKKLLTTQISRIEKHMQIILNEIKKSYD